MTGIRRTVVGRRGELGAVVGFLDGTPPAEATTALSITGPAGIGKTALWEACVEHAARGGWRVLASRPAGVEASLSFAGLADLMADVDDRQLDTLLPAPQRRALGAAVLRDDPLDGQIDARAVGTATATVIRELARDNSVLIAVDDAHWLDQATAHALAFAIRRLAGAPLGVLCTVRTGLGRPASFETSLPDDRRVDLELSPLSVAALHEVIRTRVGRSLPRPAVVRILRQTEGNVFAAVEIARELVARGEHAPGALPVPASAQELARVRIGRLPPETREALLLAAAAASPTTAVARPEVFDAAEEAGVIRVDGVGRIHFEHPLLAAAIYESASPSRRRSAHRRLVELADDQETRARHLALAADRPDESVAQALDAAAAHTATRGASAAAAELARLALERTPAPATVARAHRTLALAHHLLDAGESAASQAALEAFDAHSVAGDLRARLLRERGFGLWFEGERESGYRLVLDALQCVKDRELAARTHAAAAWLWHDSDLGRAIEHTDAALELLDPDLHPGPYSWSFLLGAYLRLVNGEGDDEEAYTRGRELQDRQIAWDDTSAVLGMWPLLHDRFAESRAFYERGLERSRSEGDVTSVQATLLRLAEIACWTGELAEADRLADECTTLADRTATAAFADSSIFVRGLVDAHLGRLDDAWAAGTEITDACGATMQGALGYWLLGLVALARGDAATADRAYGRAQAIIDDHGHHEPARFRFQPDHLEAVLELGDVSRARAMLAALERRAAVFPRPWLLATTARCRALVAAADGDLAAAAAAAEESIALHDALEMPFERARTLLVQGRILRRLKQKRSARAAFDEAQLLFAQLGAASWALITTAELRRLATRRAPDELTPTEREIALLAASGLSNPEIAARVHVSRKTVEANLARVYRKLGITSRAQLGRLIPQEAESIL